MHDAHDRVDDVDDGHFGSSCGCGVALEGVESQVRYPRSLLPHCVCRGMSEITWRMGRHPHHPTRHAVFNIWIHARTKGVLMAVGHAVVASVGIVAHIRRSLGISSANHKCWSALSLGPEKIVVLCCVKGKTTSPVWFATSCTHIE